MLLTEKYADKIQGVISCFDRVVIKGTIPNLCYSDGITSYMNAKKIRIFDYAKQFAEPLRDEIVQNAEKIADENNIEIDYIRKKNFRKEARIKEILQKRGNHPGLVHIFSALEICTMYTPWHNKKNGKTYLRNKTGKCKHYYFYFIDEQLGLVYVRVPTYCPFRLQIYFNGHNLLENKLNKKGIANKLLDNAFIYIEDFAKAQKLSDDFNISQFHKLLDKFAKKYCPVIKQFITGYHWSIWQAEYATDIMFKDQKELKRIYDYLIRTALYTVKPEHVATFLGKKFHGNYQDEIGNNFDTRIMGTRLRHSMGKSSIKIYDKFSLVLRIETSTYDVTFFKHYREVEQRDGQKVMKLTHMKKAIYSLKPLQELLMAANKRYLAFISTLDDNSNGVDKLNKITKSVKEETHSYKGFNFFNEEDEEILRTVISGEYNISGFQNKNIRSKIKNKNSSQISRVLKRLRMHGLIKRIRRTYKYYLTALGRQVILLGLKIRNLVVIPALQN